MANIVDAVHVSKGAVLELHNITVLFASSPVALASMWRCIMAP